MFLLRQVEKDETQMRLQSIAPQCFIGVPDTVVSPGREVTLVGRGVDAFQTLIVLIENAIPGGCAFKARVIGENTGSSGERARDVVGTLTPIGSNRRPYTNLWEWVRDTAS